MGNSGEIVTCFKESAVAKRWICLRCLLWSAKPARPRCPSCDELMDAFERHRRRVEKNTNGHSHT